MKIKHVGYVPLLLAVLLVSSCGGDSSGDSTDNAKAPGSSSTPSATESKTPLPSPSATPPAAPVAAASGNLVTKPVPCKKLSAAGGFRPGNVSPVQPPNVVMKCLFESKDSVVIVSVNKRGATSFTGLQASENANAAGSGRTPRVLEEATTDGWTFAAIYPEKSGFNQIDRHLVDSAGRVLICAVGVEGSKVDATTHAGFCNALRGVLHTP